MRHTSKFRLLITVIVGVLSGGATMFGVLANVAQQLDVLYLALGAGMAAAAAGLTFLVQGHRPPPPVALPVDQRADVNFQAGVNTVAEGLASLASMSTNDAGLRGKISRVLVELAAHLIGDGSAVAAFYALGPNPEAPGTERLVKRVASRESAELPDYYEADKECGSYLLGIATGKTDRLVKDISEDPEKHRIQLLSGYEAALFVPVRAGDLAKGILILQAPKEGKIGEDQERKKYSTIAHLIGACQATADLTARVLDLPAQANGRPNGSPSVNGSGGPLRDPQIVPSADGDSAPDGERN